MRIHFLGICGTFMGGLAVIARQLGHSVEGSDQNIYPPMSHALERAGITLYTDYLAEHLHEHPDLVVIGNAMKRGNPMVEYILNQNIPYISGPQWLYEAVLQQRHVLAVSGTHGKTTTTSILTWILQHSGLEPGYLIGGVANNFEFTAALGQSKYFVIEADEYDTAFFDKRSKFLHYHPRTLIMNNLEYDHADIFPDLAAIQKQFAYLLRTVPAAGTIIYPALDEALQAVVAEGCWSNKALMGSQGEWRAENISADGTRFELWHRDQKLGKISWSMLGQHNVQNAIAAIAAAHDVGVAIPAAIAALKTFKGVKRRLEVLGEVRGVTVYDDFAHHPTAIAATLKSLRSHIGPARLIAVLQFASNTMQAGVHIDQMVDCLREADVIYLLKPEPCHWPIEQIVSQLSPSVKLFDTPEGLLKALLEQVEEKDHVLIMSNKGFYQIHQRLLSAL